MGEPVLRQAGDVAALELDACRVTARSAPDSRLKKVLLPAPFGPMIEVIAPRSNSAVMLFERDELAERLADARRAQDHRCCGRAHGFIRFRSVPQMPAGKNSTQATKTAPTTSCQCTVQSETRFSSSRNTAGADEGPEERAHAAEQRHHHDHAGGLVMQDLDRHDRQMQRRKRAGKRRRTPPDSMKVISRVARHVVAARRAPAPRSRAPPR